MWNHAFHIEDIVIACADEPTHAAKKIRRRLAQDRHFTDRDVSLFGRVKTQQDIQAALTELRRRSEYYRIYLW